MAVIWLISTLNGKLPIENISVGEYVLATNVGNNDISYKKVTNLFRNKMKHMSGFTYMQMEKRLLVHQIIHSTLNQRDGLGQRI